MSTDPNANHRLVIAGWRLEEERHCLLRDGEPAAKLEPKTTELLAYMARHCNEPLSRRDLLAAVWQGTVVGDEVLTTAINKIRKAFGDDHHNPHVIETIPKMGYRLIAPVQRQSLENGRRSIYTAPSAPAVPGGLQSMDPDRRSRWKKGSVILAATLAVVSGLIIASLAVKEPIGEDAATKTVRLDSRPAVTVWPFEVLGDDPEQQYLARGLTTDLIAQLSTLSGLFVTTASTDSHESREFERASLDKRYEVWGGVRRYGQDLKIEVRLVETDAGRQLWVERYKRPFGDLFDVQHEISTRLAQKLSVQVNDVERDRLAHRYTRSVAAYDLFLRAQSDLLVRRKENNERAEDLYMQAVRIDPTFARAYGGLALIHAGNYRNQWTDDRQVALETALRFARTAVEIDPLLPEAHWALAYVKVQQREHGEALDHLDEALRLQPNFADALALKGGIKTYVGEPKATVSLLRKATRKNPEAGYLYFMTLGRAYFFLGDWVQAAINLREAAARNPATLEVRVYLAAALAAQGELADAEWEAEEIRAIRPDFSTGVWLETYPMTDTRQIAQLTAQLSALGLR